MSKFPWNKIALTLVVACVVALFGQYVACQIVVAVHAQDAQLVSATQQ